MARRFRLISCEISRREVCAATARSRQSVDAVFLPKGLHDIGRERMSARLQEAIDGVPAGEFEAVLLWYGLCNNGICGLRAALPLVIPRAHDCVTLLLGSRRRYAGYFLAHPGTFYKSAGWIEHDSDPNDNPASVTSRLKMRHDRAALAADYGAEAADYLAPAMADWFRNYTRVALIDTGVGDLAAYREHARNFAAGKNLEYEELQGDSGLLDRLVNGEWDPADFLVVPPGKTIRPTYGEDVIECGE
jgi:hypothetical protein